jgi:uncharacterized protein YhaN
MKRKAFFVLLLLCLLALSGCWSDDPVNAPTFWDVLFSRDDKVRQAENEWQEEFDRHREAIEAERTDQAQARADTAQANAATAEAVLKTAYEDRLTAQADAEAAQARESEVHWKAVEEQARGDNYIKASVAQSITNQSRMLMALQVVVIAFACFGFGVTLLFVGDVVLRRFRGSSW